MRRPWWSLIAFLTLVHCGVEAGNPGDDEDDTKTGEVKVHFAQAPRSGNESFQLGLEGIELRSGSGEAEFSAGLTAAASEVDLYGLTSTDSDSEVLAATSDAVPVGTYERIVVTLTQSRPIFYRDSTGQESEVALESTESRSFYVEQAVEIRQGETTELVIDLDARRSLIPTDGGPLVFTPRGEADGRRRGVTYQGTMTDPAGAWVCAYLYDPIMPPRPDGPPPSGSRPMPPPPPGSPMKPRPVFATKADVVKDDAPDCPNAHDRVPVGTDGQWFFPRLRPGTYDFRLFRTDGSWLDVDSDIRLEPPTD